MSAEACTLALKNTLTEIRKVCPDIRHAFVAKEGGEALAEDESTTLVELSNSQEAIRSLYERAVVAGGVDSVIFRCAEAKVNVIRFDDIYMTTVFSNSADEKTVSNLTRVMIPATLRLVQNIYPTLKSRSQTQEAPERPEPKNFEIQPDFTEVEASEFTVENLTGFGGFLNDPDIAYVDSALLAKWKEEFGDKPIKLISIESPSTGRTTKCKFRPFKDSKYDNKGIVQLPEKIQIDLRISKGAPVLVKPIIEVNEAGEAAPAQDSTEESVKERAEMLKPVVFNDLGSFTKEAPVSQLIVENLRGFGGLISGHEGARVDTGMIAWWTEMFGDKEITEITVEETVLGKKIKCKFQPIKDSSLEGKGVIQLPEKLQQALLTKKGALVTVKPVVK